jgi:hypothetical protein
MDSGFLSTGTNRSSLRWYKKEEANLHIHYYLSTKTPHHATTHLTTRENPSYLLPFYNPNPCKTAIMFSKFSMLAMLATIAFSTALPSETIPKHQEDWNIW